MKYSNLCHYGDICAIPMFLIVILYFYQIKSKTNLEWFIFIFSILGFLLDILYTLIWMKYI
jgi:hypothetical protein